MRGSQSNLNKREAEANSADVGLVLCFFGFENDLKAFSGSWMKAFLPAAPFSCGSGVGKRCTRRPQTYLGGALDLGRGQRFELSILLVRMPGGTVGLDCITHEQ